jgi:hypothetical protein
MTFIELEFDTTAAGRAPLGDIASSLVAIDELLRDLATIAAYPSAAEFRDIQVLTITTKNPLVVKLSLLAIPMEAIKAFQEICRVIAGVKSQAAIDAALAVCARAGGHESLTDRERRRILGHIATLQNAEIRLKAVVVKGQS